MAMNPGADLLGAAAGYARRGWHVFPVRTDKTPLTRRGHLEATTDRGQIVAWWRRWPSAGIGIACRSSGFLVVDVDPRHGGDTSLHGLEREHGALPDTWTSRTGGGGEHRFFIRPSGELADRPITPGVDTKSNGYIIAPPSSHLSGRRYDWLTGFAPEDLPLAAAPAWLAELVAASSTGRLQRDGTPLIIADGARNATLMRLGALLRRYGLNREAIEGCLRAVNKSHCAPPVGDDEIRRIATSCARYTPAASIGTSGVRAAAGSP